MVAPSFDNSTTDPKSRSAAIEHAANELLSKHPHFHGRDGNFDFECQGDLLIIRGRVPTTYLKHVLETALEGLDPVVRIDNRVDIVSSDGVSSVRAS